MWTSFGIYIRVNMHTKRRCVLCVGWVAIWWSEYSLFILSLFRLYLLLFHHHLLQHHHLHLLLAILNILFIIVCRHLWQWWMGHLRLANFVDNLMFIFCSTGSLTDHIIYQQWPNSASIIKSIYYNLARALPSGGLKCHCCCLLSSVSFISILLIFFFFFASLLYER